MKVARLYILYMRPYTRQNEKTYGSNEHNYTARRCSVQSVFLAITIDDIVRCGVFAESFSWRIYWLLRCGDARRCSLLWFRMARFCFCVYFMSFFFFFCFLVWVGSACRICISVFVYLWMEVRERNARQTGGVSPPHSMRPQLGYGFFGGDRTER